MTINQAAWKTNDKEWMKQRRSEWKDYEFNLKQMAAFNKDRFSFYKEYFLTGSNDALNEIFAMDRPFTNIPCWLEMWLHADDSIETLREIVVRMNNPQGIKTTFEEASGRKYKGVSYYNGKDLKMYKAMFTKPFNRDYRKFNSEEEFSDFAFGTYASEMRRYKNFFLEEPINEYDFCQLTVPFWKSAFLLGYREYVGLEYFLESLESVYNKGDSAPEIHLDLAKEIEEVLSSPDLPQEAQDAISKIRQKLRGK